MRRLPADRLVVVAPAWPGASGFDAGLGFPVVRRHGYLLFRGLRRLVAEHGVHTAWIPAAAPFAMYAPLVKAAGVRRLVASTHGQEIGWFRAAPTRAALRAVSRTIDALTYLTDTCRAEVAAALGDRTRLVQLAGAVDPSRFRPGLDGATARRRHGLGAGPSSSACRASSSARVTTGFWTPGPRSSGRHPGARLVIVGEGPMRRRLADRAEREVPGTVTLLPGRCRTRTCRATTPPRTRSSCRAATSAAACRSRGSGCRCWRRRPPGPGRGRAVRGSPESVLDGETGMVVDAGRPP